MLENRLYRRHPLVQIIFDNWFYLVVAIVMWRLPHILGDIFDQEIQPSRPQGNRPVFWMGVFIQLYILVILAMSYNLIFGFAGILSFGHALFFGTGVYGLVILMTHYSYSLETSLLVALAIATLLGLFASVAVFRIKGIYFAMFTLALAQIFHDLARVNLFKFLTNGDDGRTLDGLPDWINPISNRLAFYYICALLAGLIFVFIRRLMNSPTGKVILAIRDNEERAQTMGYNTVLYKALVVVLGGTLGALAGVLHAIFTRQAEPTTLNVTRTIDPLFMTIIGGTGTNPGPVIGAAIIHLGETFFRKPDLQINLDFVIFNIRATANTTEIWRVILGVAFVVIVLLIPHGVVGQINLLWIQMRQWGRKYFYDRMIRRRPEFAYMMQPITGETPQTALVLAEATRDASLLRWLMAYPWAAAYAVVIMVAVLGGLIAWDTHRFFSLLLFLSLIVSPVVIPLWLRQNYDKLLANATYWMDFLRR